jgi:hypothetical protein
MAQSSNYLSHIGVLNQLVIKGNDSMKKLFIIGILIFDLLGTKMLLAQSKSDSIASTVIESEEVREIVVKFSTQNQAKRSGAKFLPAQALSAMPFAKAAIPFSEKTFSPNSSLSGIYRIELKEGESAQAVIRQLKQYVNVLYAEPMHQESLLHVPNDPKANTTTGDQGYLSVIKAYEAWDITKGNKNIIIGISDTGVDFAHNDISPKIYTNPNEIENNLDDDNNGYIDDLHGYDFAEGDNNPQCVISFHGNRVAGLAGAATNNGIGMAGTGYNCTISPLKVFRDNQNTSYNSYESILYAADNGYDVLNLSWGTPNGYSKFIKDIIDYAVIEKDVVIVAAAGNTHGEIDYYPASYENVLSVGWTDNSDNKASSATYSYLIDLVAPGQGITSAFKDNGYASDNGSSYASPMVAGTAALARDLYPHLNAQQIREVLRRTTDDIYTVGSNKDYQDQLGSGRLNMLKALSTKGLKSVRANSYDFFSDFDGLLFFGDTVDIEVAFTSFLTPAANTSISISSPSTYLSFPDQLLNLSFEDSMQTKKISINNIFIHEDTPPSSIIPIKITYSASNYTDFQYFKILTAPDYLDIDNGKMAMTIETNGNLGITSNQESTLGIIWNDFEILTQMGLIIGTSADKISDNAVTSFESGNRNQKFTTVDHLRYEISENAPWLAKNTFSETANNLKIEQKTYAFTDATLDDVIVLEYRVTNTTASAISGLSVGLLANWDLTNETSNRAFFDSQSGICYTNTSENSLFSGMKIYEQTAPIVNSLDIQSLNTNTSDLAASIDNATKYELITKSKYDSAGKKDIGNDVAQSIASGAISLEAYGSKKITFFLAAANTLDALKGNIANAELNYKKILNNPKTLETFPTCGNSPVIVNPTSGTKYRFYKDALGQTLISEGESITISNFTKDTSVFVQNIDNKYALDIERVLVKVVEKQADFSVSKDTLYLENNQSNEVLFTDLSINAKTWNWDFGNGLQSSNANPKVKFTESGYYNVQLTVVNLEGCVSKASKKVLVIKRPEAPHIADQTICKNEIFTVNAGQNETLNVYSSDISTTSVFKGSTFSSAPLNRDTAFYISSSIDGIESIKQKVNVSISLAQLDFAFQIDTISNENKVWITTNIPNLSSYKWSVDGQQVSTKDSLQLLVETKAYTIKLETISPSGCSESITKTFTFSKSKKPVVTNTKVCAGADYTINPTNGQIFGFYKDQSLTNLIDKGRILTIKNISSDTAIYIVGLDNGVESDITILTLSIIKDEILIVATPEKLNLIQGKNVNLKYTGSTLLNPRWYVSNELVATTLAEIDLFFTEVGTKEIRLEGTDILGCFHSKSIDYNIISSKEDGAVPLDVQKDNATQISITPNPFTEKVTLKGLAAEDIIEITDLTGRMIFQTKSMYSSTEIDLSFIATGVYSITIKHDGTFKHAALLIRK